MTKEKIITANEQIDTRRFTESVLTGVKSGVLGVTQKIKFWLIDHIRVIRI